MTHIATMMDRIFSSRLRGQHSPSCRRSAYTMALPDLRPAPPTMDAHGHAELEFDFAAATLCIMETKNSAAAVDPERPE